MPRDQPSGQPVDSRSTRPLLWTGVVLLGAFAVASLSLPWDTPESIYDVPRHGELFRSEWFVAGTLLVFPIGYAARAHWAAALVVIVLPAAQMMHVADTAVDLAARYGLDRPGDDVWYLVACAQAVLFVFAGLLGSCDRMVERRWAASLVELPEGATSGLKRRGLE